MSEKESKVNEFFKKGRLTLDLAGLTDEEREVGSIFLGGSAAEFVGAVENFQYDRVGTVVFRWGDQAAQDVFANLLEHIESPHETILPFAASTIVNGNIWSLALQAKDFSTEKAYRSSEDYIELPFDEEGAEALLADIMASDARKQIIGKVGSRYVLFEMATTLNDEINEPVEIQQEAKSLGDKLSDKDAIEVLEKLIENWSFDGDDEQANSRFALHIAYWALETFGHNVGEPGWWSTTKYEKEIDGDQLPAELQPLITHLWRDEPYVSGDNSVTMQARPEYIEEDPVIPRWDEIEEIETFEGQLDFVRSQPDILKDIVLTRIAILPQVSVRFEPTTRYDWGVEFLVNELGIRLAPFGREGKTMTAADFAIEMQDKTSEASKIASQLVLLCVKFAQSHTGGEVETEKLHQLGERIFGGANIPLDSEMFRNMASYQSKPGNAVKNLLLRRLQESGDLS